MQQPHLPAAVDCSPSPALLAWSDACSGLAWEINAAARDWALARAWTQEHWNALAAAVLECTAPTRRSSAALGVRWRSVPEAGGLLAWLMPLEPGGVEAEVQALRERVAELGGQLDAAQELGSRPGSLAVDSDSAELARRLQASSTQLALAVGLVGIVLWRYDFAAGLVQFNDQGYKLLGFKRRAEGVPLAEARGVIHPQDREQVELAAQQAVASIGVVDVEARYMTAAGTWSTQLTRRIAERDPQGRAVALVGVSMDMTEQRATLERLRQAEQRAMIAIQAASMGVWEFDLLTGEVYWDAQMYVLRGLDPADSRPPALLRDLAVHPQDLPRLQQRIHDVAEEGTIYQEQYRVVWPDGSVHWLAVRGMVARDARGRGTRMFGVNWDITEHKLNEDMRRDKAAAEQASRAKSEFLAHMSHELRTPLNAVLGFAQLMLEDPGEPLERQQRLRAQRIRNAGKHLLALIDDVLDFSSMESGSLPLDRAPVALGPLVQETLQWLAPAAERAGVSLHAPSSDGEVMGDERRLRQVLANLLSNAVKYNRPGGRVELALIDSAAADGMLGFSVRDTGRGLAPEQLRRLFEPFNRLGAEREGIEGTGIGLTIVHHLVERMGGRIEVDSQHGVGSEFLVWLPRATSEVTRHATTAGMPLDMRVKPDGAMVDVLYIEDNPVNMLLVEELINLRPGFRLRKAATGLAGIELARLLKPKLVLIDLQLPDIDGFEVLQALRAEPRLRDAVCIALSANAMPQDIARAREAGFDDYWTKPIDFTQFLAGLDMLTA